MKKVQTVTDANKDEFVIRVENVHKSFKMYSDKGSTFKERLLFRSRRVFERHVVLNGISFMAKKGESIGLIGQNGCGKSTLLKLLTRILYPDQGAIYMSGRISSLLELGAGFHPDLSGRENIYANAAIFGLKKKEVDVRLQSIIDYSGLEEYIDNPVRTYSSGMYTRLAFSVAINVDADILLIDEILAVGDVNFQAKCLKSMRNLRDSGVTIIFVSHDATTVKSFCNRAIWINNGKIISDGNSADTVDKYLAYMKQQQATNQEDIKKELEVKTEVDRPPVMTSLILNNSNPTATFDTSFLMETTINENGKTIQSLVFNVYNFDAGRQSSVIYKGVKNANGFWNATFDLFKQGNLYGNYIVEVYVVDTDNAEYSVGWRQIKLLEIMASNQPKESFNENHFGSGDTSITSAYFINAKGEKTKNLESGAPVTLEIRYLIKKRSSGYNFGMAFYSSSGQLVYGTNMNSDNIFPKNIPDNGYVCFKMEKLSLLRGEYKLHISIMDENQQPLDYYRVYSDFSVFSNYNAIGVSVVDHEWIIP